MLCCIWSISIMKEVSFWGLQNHLGRVVRMFHEPLGVWGFGSFIFDMGFCFGEVHKTPLRWFWDIQLGQTQDTQTYYCPEAKYLHKWNSVCILIILPLYIHWMYMLTVFNVYAEYIHWMYSIYIMSMVQTTYMLNVCTECIQYTKYTM